MILWHYGDIMLWLNCTMVNSTMVL